MTQSTYGQRFLTRLMESEVIPSKPFVSEAPTSPEDREDGLVDGFNIPLDAQTRALASRVKMPMARRIVALMFMAGIPGRYLAAEEVEGGILAATDTLRKKASVRKAFLDFYNALGAAKGFATPGDKPEVDPEAELRQESLEDNEEHKKGDYIQKLFTTVLIQLGMPASFAGVSAPSIIANSLMKTADEIAQDGALERSLRMLALRMGIRGDDVRSGVQTESDDDFDNDFIDEAFDAGQDEFMTTVIQVVEALGIPPDVLERRKPQVIKALRARKLKLRNRAMLLTNMRRLLSIIASNEAKDGQQGDEE